MFTGSRRIFLYWLLLLLPTLVVGAGAILLLRREQSRLAERSQYADEARRAAVSARARLVVENAELLIGDVQTGLLDTLVAEPAHTLEGFFAEWERTNPFVRTGFLATAGGQLLRPSGSPTDEEGKGFLRRFATRFSAEPPWTDAAEKKKASLSFDEAKEREEGLARSQVVSNISKVQAARESAQRVSRQNSYEMMDSRADAAATASSAPAPAAARMPKLATTSLAEKSSPPADRRGWQSWVVDGRLHRLGWVQVSGETTVRGVELELAALTARLGETLPASVEPVEGFALRDEQGRVLHQVGAVPRDGEPAYRVPFASELLPGWEVVAFLPVIGREQTLSGGFFLVGSLLVGIFVIAILVGGSLLLWQARRSEAEAAQKTSFVANVSHEFKTPLTTIRLYAELLEQGRVRDAGQGAEYLRTIGRETQRLARLVGNVLDFSRLEQGKKKFAREPVELSFEVARLLDTQSPRLAEAGLSVTREWPHAPVRVATDRDALEQIFLNVLDNACKYAGSGGELTVRLAAKAGGGAVLSVLDRGPGVPAAHREKIFEKFHRVDETLTAEKAGAGLGLSIARQLARGSGGDLRCEERGGGGASFVVELP